SGSASVADYQAVLRGVTYQDTSADPTPGSRVITFRVSDDFAANALSIATARAVNVTAVNNAPTLAVPSSVCGVRDTDIAIEGISTADVDNGSSSASLTLSVAHGKLRFANLDGVTVTGGANNSASVTITGSIATLNGALAGGNLMYRPAVFYR